MDFFGLDLTIVSFNILEIKTKHTKNMITGETNFSNNLEFFTGDVKSEVKASVLGTSVSAESSFKINKDLKYINGTHITKAKAASPALGKLFGSDVKGEISYSSDSNGNKSTSMGVKSKYSRKFIFGVEVTSGDVKVSN